MFTRFCNRVLLFAKTAVAEPVKNKKAEALKAKAAADAAAAKAKADARAARDAKKKAFKGNRLFELLDALPKPSQPLNPDSFLHKNGFGLKFYRDFWTRYPEPCYWTVVRYKPRMLNGPSKTHATAWGVLTWRGVTEAVPRKIRGPRKRQWKVLLEPGTKLGPSKDDYITIPPITAESKPFQTVLLPPGLKNAGPWPYPFFKTNTTEKKAE